MVQSQHSSLNFLWSIFQFEINGAAKLQASSDKPRLTYVNKNQCIVSNCSW